MTHAVEQTADIRDAHSEIDSRAVAIIRERLHGDAPVVGWVAAWLLDEKSIQTTDGHPQVFVCEVVRETDKAFQIDQDATDTEPVWVPKSQARLFELADGVGEIESNQSRLTDL